MILKSSVKWPRCLFYSCSAPAVKIKNQLQSQRNLQREKYRNLSETAKRDLRKRRQKDEDNYDKP